ncbi:positive regulator of sigma-B [Gracilibacillus boraciitolerans JCM 21714]|uniref:Positive regulator of sigma-B n=1 Tax=Gracilibacillus boraciitolerans JCM 21714 TaxID=1298598 RepID=W4VL53_9BACI|nr:positive regulator of sigma-B [Gracilibacillus boraciitolerans JCM 21714]
MPEVLRKIVVENSDIISKNWLDEITEKRKSDYTSNISESLYHSTNQEFINVIFSSINHRGDTVEMDDFAERLINLGWPLSYITDGLQTFRRVTIEFILNQSDKVDTNEFSRILKIVEDG